MPTKADARKKSLWEMLVRVQGRGRVNYKSQCNSKSFSKLNAGEAPCCCATDTLHTLTRTLPKLHLLLLQSVTLLMGRDLTWCTPILQRLGSGLIQRAGRSRQEGQSVAEVQDAHPQ